MPNRSGKKSSVVRLSNEQERVPLSLTKLKVVGKLILELLHLADVEVSFLFVTDRRIKIFNRQYRGKNRPTDVLAFSQMEGKSSPAVGSKLLGDVIISVDTTERQAPLYRHSFKEELILYMIHGVLHLLGYDDEQPAPRKIMRQEEERIMNKIRRKFPDFVP